MENSNQALTSGRSSSGLGRRRAPLAGVFLTLGSAWSAAPALAEDACRATVGLAVCDAIPKGRNKRLEALAHLDEMAREAVAGRRYREAALFFTCLLQADPRPETAMNLALIEEQNENFARAVLAVGCAERLSVGKAALAKTRAKREELERKLPRDPSPEQVAQAAPGDTGRREVNTLTVEPSPTAELDLVSPFSDEPAALDVLPSTPPVPNLTGIDSSIAGDAEESRGALGTRRAWGMGALVLSAAALIATGITYGLALERAGDFHDEQRALGYTERARDLRASAGYLRTSAAAGLGVTTALGLLSTALFVF